MLIITAITTIFVLILYSAFVISSWESRQEERDPHFQDGEV
jgi:hypothetical protein